MKEQILEMTATHVKNELAKKTFIPGKTLVPYAGRIYDEAEVCNAVSASLDFWLTLGPWGRKFERKIAEHLNVKHACMVNSGSSANLLAFSALLSPKLERPLKSGDEVITAAAGFPTTVNPILQNGCIPVFVDVDPQTLLPKPEWVEQAISPKTRAVFLAHTLGNVLDLDPLLEICRKHNLYFIEDNCDALDSEYDGKKTGAFGDLSTLSMYPAHHMTTGEGGCVFTNDSLMDRIVGSLRDWGKDCWCPPGIDNTCNKRFDWQLGSLPLGYDHKYIFSHIGYNLKPTDMQAAIGVAQLEKLPSFTQVRRKNYDVFVKALAPYSEWIDWLHPTPKSTPSWFLFFMRVKPNAPFKRQDLVTHLESKRIQTRMLFGGNLLRQPAYQNAPTRVAMPLLHTDEVMDQGLGIGLYPGITTEMQTYMIDILTQFFKKYL